MKVFLKIAAWLGIFLWFLIVLGFVSREADQVLCNRIDVVFNDSTTGFVGASDIRSWLEKSEFELQGYPLEGINIRAIEELLEKNPYVNSAEVSTDITGRLEVGVEQRKAMVRIMPHGKAGFYLDEEARLLPLSDRFTPHVLLVSGYLEKPEAGKELSEEMFELYRFCAYVCQHKLWSEQIVQIYVNRKGEYELIPRVGAHQILMGSLEEWERKLQNLELLYKQGLPAFGWNNYEQINLKYTNQVICTKR